MTIPVFRSLNGLALTTRTPVATMFRRVRELGIEPDAIVVSPRGQPIQLFADSRLPEIRRALAIRNKLATR